MNAGTNFRSSSPSQNAPALTSTRINAKVASRLTEPGRPAYALEIGMHSLTRLEPDVRGCQPAQQVNSHSGRQGQADNDQTQPHGQPILGRVPGFHSALPFPERWPLAA